MNADRNQSHNMKDSRREIGGNKILIFLENEAQVRDWISRGELDNEGTIVTLSPFSMYELDRHGISYRIPEDYYNPQELYELGMANFQKVECLCTIIDGIILKSCPLAKQKNITPALFSFYHLKMMYDAMTIRLFQLSKIFTIEKPDLVYIYNTEKYPFGYHNTAPFIQFDNRESIYSQLLALDNWNVKLKIIEIKDKFEKQTPIKRKKVSTTDLNIYISKHLHQPELKDMGVIFNSRGFPGLLKWLWYHFPSSKESAPVALLGGGYEWHEIIIELRARNIFPIYRIHHDLYKLLSVKPSEYLNAAWQELVSNRKFLDFFIYNNLDFFPVIKGRIQFLVIQLTMASMAATQHAEVLIEKRKIKAFLSPAIANCIEHSVARVAHNKGIPVITWQHGAYGAMFHPIINYVDLISSDFHFVFGIGIEGQYAKSAESFSTSLVPVGSAILERLQKRNLIEKKIPHDKKIVLYITSSGYQNNLYISYFPPFSDNLFWKTQKAIVDVLGSHNECSVIMKLHPSNIYIDPDIQSYVKSRGYNNFEFIKTEKTISDLLSIADVVVIDMPSTTLLQALTTKKPIFVFMGHIKFDAEPLRLLENRAVCRENLGEFISDLNEYLTNNNYNKDLHNNNYLKMFGIAEGSAAERAAGKLREIIDTFKIKK